jgi:hypothetical protein
MTAATLTGGSACDSNPDDSADRAPRDYEIALRRSRQGGVGKTQIHVKEH